MTVARLRIAEISFEAAEGLLRLRGVNTTANATMKIGQYHTFTLDCTSTLSVFKDTWDELHLDTLRRASDVTAKAGG